ncbi:gamma carbonic anhydrase family protein [Aliidiomarina indica]|uniref:gamma carbonic anhydrase family protein n=1 Tax=Aliidiomarina indica TaxID=2749147 RepID=UPI0018903325|nr:gamma carbonic anhydrase family protein [Aliidiomarina indica]
MSTNEVKGRPYKGQYPQLGARCYVDPSAVIVGDIQIGDDSSIWPLVAARGDVNHIRIGARTNIQDGSVLHVTRTGPDDPHGYPLLIGDDVTVGHHCMLHGCVVGNRILVGMSAVVMDGAVVEDDVIIGAGSLVPPGKRLQSGYLYVGSPVKKARELTGEERDFLQKSAANYVYLKDEYLKEAQS